MLSTTDLALMRAQQSAALTDTVVIQRRTLVSDGAGGQAETWAAVLTTAGRLAPASSSREVAQAGKLAIVRPFRLTLPALTAVQETDRALVGGRTFEIVALSAGNAWETARVCLCAEIV